MKKKKRLNDEEIIIGIIKEIEDNDDSDIAILAEGEYYIVEMNKQGKKLLNEIENKVEATGSIQIDPDGTNRIAVSSFEVFEPEDDFVDSDDYYTDDDYDAEDRW